MAIIKYIYEHSVLVVKTIQHWIKRYMRKSKQTDMRRLIRNTDFSLFCNNCVGGLFYHDLGLKFTVPTINLIIKPAQYIKFISNLDKYRDADLVQVFNYPQIPYPVGLLGGEIEIYFVHYKSFEEAVEKWHERFGRVNYNNVIFLLIEKDGCTKEDIIKFCNLPYKNKRVVSHFGIKGYNDIWIVNEDTKLHEAEDLTQYEGLSGKRRYDELNFVEWVNSISPESYQSL